MTMGVKGVSDAERTSSVSRWLAWASKYRVLVMSAAIAGGALLIGEQSSALNAFTVQILINVVIVIGLYVFIGNSGVMSWGHISFMAIAAYATGLLTIPVASKRFLLVGLPHWLAELHMSGLEAAVVAVALSCVFAAVAGAPLMRLKGLPAAIATFCLLIVVNTVLSQSTNITGGEQALVGVPIQTTLVLCVVCVVGCVLIASAFDRTTIALKLRAARDDRAAAEAAGIGVVRERMAAFVLSAAIVAVAGVLDAHYVGAFTPDDFYFDLTFITIAMLVVGGTGSLGGALFGALGLGTFEGLLNQLQDGNSVLFVHLTLPDGVSEMVLAVVMVVVLIAAPRGVLAALVAWWQGRVARSGKHAQGLATLSPEAVASEPGTAMALEDR